MFSNKSVFCGAGDLAISYLKNHRASIQDVSAQNISSLTAGHSTTNQNCFSAAQSQNFACLMVGCSLHTPKVPRGPVYSKMFEKCNRSEKYDFYCSFSALTLNFYLLDGRKNCSYFYSAENRLSMVLKFVDIENLVVCRTPFHVTFACAQCL